jgi:hypothetical protein
VVLLAEIALLDYLADGAYETARRLVPIGVERLHGAPHVEIAIRVRAQRRRERSALTLVLAHQPLVVHPNTVHYRLRRVQDLTGREAHRFAELAELTTALRLLAR